MQFLKPRIRRVAIGGGYAGAHLATKELSLYRIYVAEPVFTNSKQTIENPHRDLMHGGTLFERKGKQYWVSDDCLLGKVCKYIYGRGRRRG